MKTRFFGAAAALALLASISPASANVIVNGGFEFPSIGETFYENYGTFTNSPYAGPNFQGWTIKSGTNVDIVNPLVGWGAAAYEGAQVLDLVGYGSTGGIAQKFSTVLGETYAFSFAYANNTGNGETGAAADFRIFGASTLLAGSVFHNTSVNGNLDWIVYSGTFVADSTTTGLRFNETLGGNNGGVLLDAISVSAVPEPATWLMMLISFAGLGFAAYRRTKLSPGVAT